MNQGATQKKQNKANVGQASVLHFIENAKQTQTGNSSHENTKRSQNGVAPSSNACGCLLRNEPKWNPTTMKMQNKANSALVSGLFAMVYCAKQSQISAFSIEKQWLPKKQTQNVGQASRLVSKKRNEPKWNLALVKMQNKANFLMRLPCPIN